MSLPRSLGFGNSLRLSFLSIILIGSLMSISVVGQYSSRTIPSVGVISDWPRINITVDSSRVVGKNSLSLGFMLDHEWKYWSDSSVRRELARNGSFRLVRIFDFKSSSPSPCIFWNESTQTGVFNWTDVDLLVGRIFEIGAEPLFCLGRYGTDGPCIPPGMEVNSDTDLPYPYSYAAYCAEWVKHFEELGLPVRLYEIFNEPISYFGWSDTTRLAHYVEFWNFVAREMRKENPNILISHDTIMVKRVFDYWLQYGDDVDFLDFHKYDCWTTNKSSAFYYDDATMFQLAETRKFESDDARYGVYEAQQKWLDARGKRLPVINSESNFNSAWQGGTDPRIQQLVGAVWTALVIRMGIRKGLSYNIYYSFSSSASFGNTSPTGGVGFGMVNSDNLQPWYPYYVQQMIGNNLDVGDSIVSSISSSDDAPAHYDVRYLAWIHNGTINILLICKVDQPRTVFLQGLTGRVTILRIDNAISWVRPRVQTEVTDFTRPLFMDGYTVALLQSQIPP